MPWLDGGVQYDGVGGSSSQSRGSRQPLSSDRRTNRRRLELVAHCVRPG